MVVNGGGGGGGGGGVVFELKNLNMHVLQNDTWVYG